MLVLVLYTIFQLSLTNIMKIFRPHCPPVRLEAGSPRQLLSYSQLLQTAGVPGSCRRPAPLVPATTFQAALEFTVCLFQTTF